MTSFGAFLPFFNVNSNIFVFIYRAHCARCSISLQELIIM